LRAARQDLSSARAALLAAFPALQADRSLPPLEATPLLHLLKGALCGDAVTTFMVRAGLLAFP